MTRDVTKEPPKEILLINSKRGRLNKFVPETSPHYPYPMGLTHQLEHTECFDRLIAAILKVIDTRTDFELPKPIWNTLWELKNAFIAYEAVTDQFEHFGG